MPADLQRIFEKLSAVDERTIALCKNVEALQGTVCELTERTAAIEARNGHRQDKSEDIVRNLEQRLAVAETKTEGTANRLRTHAGLVLQLLSALTVAYLAYMLGLQP